MGNYIELRDAVKVSEKRLSELDDMVSIITVPYAEFERAEAEYDSAIEALDNFLASNSVDVAFEAEENFLLGYSSRR